MGNPFKGCINLTLTLPKNSKFDSKLNPFSSSIKCIISQSSKYNVLNDMLINVDNGELVCCYNKSTKIELPSIIQNIGPFAFDDGSNIEILTLDEGISKIYDSAFYHSPLQEIYLPNSIEYIGLKAFENCEKLRCIYISRKAYKRVLNMLPKNLKAKLVVWNQNHNKHVIEESHVKELHVKSGHRSKHEIRDLHVKDSHVNTEHKKLNLFFLISIISAFVLMLLIACILLSLS